MYGFSQKSRTKPRFALTFELGSDLTNTLEYNSHHIAGIQSWVKHGDSIFSAGRGGKILRHSISNNLETAPQYVSTFKYHNRWVTDIQMLTDTKIVSGSADSTVKVWDIVSTDCIKTAFFHTDYVTAIATSPTTATGPLVASSGLDHTIQLWDPSADNIYATSASLNKHSTSITSLAMSADPSPIILSGGSTGKMIAWDTRFSFSPGLRASGVSFPLMGGHTDNVRSIFISPDSKKASSVGSDGTAVLWDIGERRAIRQINIYDIIKEKINWQLSRPFNSSLWHLHSVDPISSSVAPLDEPMIVASRDGTLFTLDWNKNSLSLLARNDYVSPSSPEVDVFLVNFIPWKDDSNNICFALSSSNGKAGFFKSNILLDDTAGSECVAIEDPIDESLPEPGTSSESNVDPLAASPPSSSVHPKYSPLALKHSLTFTHGYTRQRLLNDHVHLLVQDTRSHVCLWNILKNSLVTDYGIVDFDKKVGENRNVDHVPRWITTDIRSYRILVSIEPETAFDAVLLSNTPPISLPTHSEEVLEVSEVSEGAAEETQETPSSSLATTTTISHIVDRETVNLGARVIFNLFRNWIDTCPDITNPYLPNSHGRTGQYVPQYPGSTRVSITHISTCASLFTLQIKDLTFENLHPDIFPLWLRKCLLEGKLYPSEKSNFYFYLSPDKHTDNQRPTAFQGWGKAHVDKVDPSSDLAGSTAWLIQWSLRTTKMTCPRYLLARDLCLYVFKALRLSFPEKKGVTLPIENLLELRCRGKVIPPLTSMYTIQDLYWRRKGQICELLFYFNVDYRNILVNLVNEAKAREAAAENTKKSPSTPLETKVVPESNNTEQPLETESSESPSLALDQQPETPQPIEDTSSSPVADATE